MSISKAQQKAVKKYMSLNYDEAKIRMDKGLKETVRAHAIKNDGSLNAFFNRAIKETMERDKAPVQE